MELSRAIGMVAVLLGAVLAAGYAAGPDEAAVHAATAAVQKAPERR